MTDKYHDTVNPHINSANGEKHLLLCEYSPRDRCLDAILPLGLLPQPSDVGLDARDQVCRLMYRLPTNRPTTVRPAARVGAYMNGSIHRAPVPREFLVRQLRRPIRSANPDVDQRLRDRLADIVPGVLVVLAEVEAFPAMTDALRVCRDRVEKDDV